MNETICLEHTFMPLFHSRCFFLSLSCVAGSSWPL